MLQSGGREIQAISRHHYGRTVIYIAQAIAGLVNLLTGLVIIWCLLSWFPNIKWYDQPFRTLDQIVSPIINPFRKLIPPISGIDLSPIIALLIIQAVGNVLISIIVSI